MKVPTLQTHLQTYGGGRKKARRSNRPFEARQSRDRLCRAPGILRRRSLVEASRTPTPPFLGEPLQGPEVAQEDAPTVPDEIPGGEVLDLAQSGVHEFLPQVPVPVFRAACLSHVNHPRPRDEHAGTPESLRTEPEIDVLEIGEEVFIEESDLLEQGTPVEHGSTRSGEHLLFLIVLPPVRLPSATVRSAGVRLEHVAHAFDAFPVLRRQYLRSEAARLRVLLRAPCRGLPASPVPPLHRCSTEQSGPPAISRIPSFTALQKPKFLGRASTRTPGQCDRMYSTEPSRDPLSTTVIRYPDMVWRERDSRLRGRTFIPFQFGMTTSINSSSLFVPVPVCVPVFWPSAISC